jgi:flagellar FliJ protein
MSPPFRFRLERLLRLRERAERQQAQALGAALRTEQEQRAALDEARTRLERIGEQLEQSAAGTQTAGTLRVLRLTVNAAAEDIEHAEARHEDASAQVEQEQTRFREARKERRVVERLRERRVSAWRTDEARQEQKDTDDVAQRRRRGGETP